MAIPATDKKVTADISKLKSAQKADNKAAIKSHGSLPADDKKVNADINKLSANQAADNKWASKPKGKFGAAANNVRRFGK